MFTSHSSLTESDGGGGTVTVVLTDSTERQPATTDFLSAHGGLRSIGRHHPARPLIGGEKAGCRLQRVTSRYRSSDQTSVVTSSLPPTAYYISTAVQKTPSPRSGLVKSDRGQVADLDN